MRSLFFRSTLVALTLACSATIAPGKSLWFKGNTHTHSFWSDGDEFPEMIADWYKTNHYAFLAFSDHNSIQDGEKWLPINDPNRPAILKKYIARFGAKAVEQKIVSGTNFVRLKRFQEFHPLFEEKDKFLLLRGEELSATVPGVPLHIGAVNVTSLIEPRNGTNVNDITKVIDQNLAAIFEQRKKTRQPILAHVNHPNFRWAITAEELMAVKNEKFFEVFNGHPHVYNSGDASHASTERVWDVMLTHRLTDLKLPVVYGIATDDSHHYQVWGERKNNPGEGWILVRAKRLSAPDLINAMENGDFYASSGVTLRDVRREKKNYTVEVDPANGVDYTIQFFGTRLGFDPTSKITSGKDGPSSRLTRQYSPTIGELLQETTGPAATYKLTGDEIYVRAKVVSSKKKYSSSGKNDRNAMETFESAWTQPLVNGHAKLVVKK